MQDLIERLRQHHDSFNPPASEEQLQHLRMILQAKVHPDPEAQSNPLFDDLLALYRDHNGMSDSRGSTLPVRLLSLGEAAEIYGAMNEISWNNWDRYPFWTDDNSNYMGIYLDEPLMGYVFYLDHEEPDYSPRFRSVRCFYEELLRAAEDDRGWWTLETDFPLMAPDPAHDPADMAAAQVYIDLYQKETDSETRFDFASIAMHMLPYEMREPLVMFAEDTGNMYVQELAVRLLGLRKDEAAVPQIERIVRGRFHNPRTAGFAALAHIGSPAARDAVLRIADDIEAIGVGYAPYVLDALRKLGYQASGAGGVYSYRASSDDPWTEFARDS